MTPAEHYSMAERLLDSAQTSEAGLVAAQAHATLACYPPVPFRPGSRAEVPQRLGASGVLVLLVLAAVILGTVWMITS